MGTCTYYGIIFGICLYLSTVHCGHVHNYPVYPDEFIADADCAPYNGSEGKNAELWMNRVWYLNDTLYGYVKVTENSGYSNPLNCAIKLMAPEGYKLIARIPRIEIYHDETECTKDFVSVIGATNSLHYCGFGTVGHSIGSTSNWLIIRIVTSEWDVVHDYIGFQLYFTALHETPCVYEGNATEFQCNGHCIPDDVICDDRDNCGDWDDERSKVCGLTEGAVIAISIVTILVGGTIIFFVVYCIYSKQKEKRMRARRQAGVTPTMQVSSAGAGRAIVFTPDSRTPSGQAEPPPPYTPEAYINHGLYMGESPGQPPAANLPPTGDGTVNNVNPRVTPASNVRPAMGEPPPLYTVQEAGAGAEGNGARSVGVLSSGVSYDDLPKKESNY